MAGTGPAPNPNARRRNARPAQMTLPAAGRTGRTPKWPLPPEVRIQAELAVSRERVEALEGNLVEALMDTTAVIRAAERKLDQAKIIVRTLEIQIDIAKQAETALWRELWRTPQAEAWERLKWNREVAQYVRWKVKAEGGDLDAGKEARQLGDRLGLFPLSMLRLQWVIGTAEDKPKPSTTGNVVGLFG